ncbi:MAG TPA: ABC transporter substrate-binding protein [Actinomycetota bacterium]|nr:ABC transporter substrate-binding protein [Actinomycetota bacterium]
MQRRGTSLWAAGLAVLACLTACTGGGSVPGARATATAGAGTATGSGETTDGTPVEATPTPGVFEAEANVLDVAISEPATLDPMRIQDPGSVLVARQLFEGLTRWDPVREEVVPAAAESWKVTEGGRTFTFKLRADMTFHDGSPVEAGDFVFAFDRIARRRNASEIAYALEQVRGFAAVNQQGTAKHLAGLSAPDKRTLVVELSEPLRDLPAVLTHPSLVPVPKEAVEDIDEFLSEPVGNGPFQMARPWAPGAPVILESFPGYIQAPELDGIRFIPYPDAAASWLQFLDGDLDVAEVPSGQIQEAEREFGTNGFKPLLAGYYYGINLRAGALDDVRLRKAINRAIDREAIASTIYKGTMVPPRGIVPAGMPGFEDDICSTLCKYSARGASRLVSRLRPQERRLTLEYTRGEPHKQVASFVRKDLQRAGLDVKVKGFQFSDFLKHLERGSGGAYRLGWIAEFPVPDVFLSTLFGSVSPENHSGFRSRKIDGVLDKAHAERDEDKRVRLYQRAERMILEQAPLVPIGSFVTRWAAQPIVQDIGFDVMGGFDAADVSLDESEEGE